MADKKPGDGDANQLHEYWTRGEGLAKWSTKPHPWTALYHHLLKHIKNTEEARATAAKWYRDVFGYAPNSDEARAAHGKKPRGNRMGPG